MFKKQAIFIFSILLSANLLSVSNLYAKELRVAPPSYHWKGVEPGKKTVMPVSIMIQNCSEQARSYHLRARAPAELQLNVEKGFEPIPNTEWVFFEEVLVQVRAGGTKSVKMYVVIPKEVRFKKPWMFYVEVKEEVSRYGYLRGKPDMFALAGYPKIYLLPKER
ncbi:MAG: hypothetical protein V1925_05055 [Candidatus Omnitrophota bacterium]